MQTDSETERYNRILKESFSWFSPDNLIDPRDVIRHEYFTKIVNEIFRESGKNKEEFRIVDIGSGSGDFAIRLGKLGFNVTGFDVSSDAVELAKKKSKDLKNVNFFQSNLNNKKLSEKYRGEFCLVTMMDVLEHYRDEMEALNLIKTVMKDDGRGIISVPNNPKLWSSVDERAGHYRRYTRETLEDVISKAGFEPLKTRIIGFPFTRLVNYVHIKMSKKKTYIPEGNAAKFYKVVEPLMYTVMQLDKIFDFTEKGDELICKFKKEKRATTL